MCPHLGSTGAAGSPQELGEAGRTLPWSLGVGCLAPRPWESTVLFALTWRMETCHSSGDAPACVEG